MTNQATLVRLQHACAQWTRANPARPRARVLGVREVIEELDITAGPTA